MLRRLAVVLALGLLVTACGGGGEEAQETPEGTEGPRTEVTVSMKEFAFDPKEIAVAGGGKVELKNAGTVEHTFTVADLGIDVKVPAAQEGEASVPAKPGTYKLVCTVAGHEQAGMVGTLTVT